jgi:hypothetical protein
MSVTALSPTDTEAARRAAASILREGRFHNPSVPRPLHGVLHAIGSAAGAVGRAVVHAVDAVGRLIPGGSAVVWILLDLAVVAGSVMAARQASRRALLRERGGGRGRRAAAVQSAADLDREAARAERDGRYAEAVRLRFRAGLADLDERGAIARPGSTPNAQLARRLHSDDFDALARRFDEIAYGSAPAGAEDAEEARRRWAAVASGTPGP